VVWLGGRLSVNDSLGLEKAHLAPSVYRLCLSGPHCHAVYGDRAISASRLCEGRFTYARRPAPQIHSRVRLSRRLAVMIRLDIG
jgi:hypothetical protein